VVEAVVADEVLVVVLEVIENLLLNRFLLEPLTQLPLAAVEPLVLAQEQ